MKGNIALIGLMLAVSASEALAQQTNGDNEMRSLMIAGMKALGYDSLRSAEQMKIIAERAPVQDMNDPVLRSILIAGGWATGLNPEPASTTVRLSEELRAGGYASVYVIKAWDSKTAWTGMILNHPLPENAVFRILKLDGSTVDSSPIVRTFQLRKENSTEQYWAYELSTDQGGITTSEMVEISQSSR